MLKMHILTYYNEKIHFNVVTPIFKMFVIFVLNIFFYIYYNTIFFFLIQTLYH